MTVYQELQLNQAGSKALIRSCTNRKDKMRHTAIYLFKICLTMAFCMAVVIGFSKIFGNGNSIVGVVVLLCVMAFRFADFGIRTPHAMGALTLMFAILTFGPRLANAGGLVQEFLVNTVCILLLMVLGCHNVVMFNHSTLLLCYLLLYGYDVTGDLYIQRLIAMGIGAAATLIVYYRNHRKKVYKRSLGDIFKEFDIHSLRTRWQITMVFGVTTAMLIAGLLHVPRRMWIGIAAMSILVPFHEDAKKRAKSRVPGNIVGCFIFLALYYLLPPSIYNYVGVIGGIGVGLSATYGCQAVFNTFGALSIAVGILGLPGAVFFRIFNNFFGAVYGVLFEFWIGCRVMDNKKHPRQTRTIFYLRCAAYFRLLPRTRTQKLRAQTHSRRRAMLTPMTKIDLPSCLWMFFYCPIYMMAPGCRACNTAMKHFVHAQI